MKPVFKENARTWGFNEEGMRMYLTDERYIWITDKDSCITYYGELVRVGIKSYLIINKEDKENGKI